MFPPDILALAERVTVELKPLGLSVATAESCTGGLIAAAITEISGSSAVLERGFVTYSNEAKIGLLAVAPTTLAEHGAVSAATIEAMAQGALRACRADLAVAVSGIAGPTGGSPEKPVGLVFLAVARRGAATRVERLIFTGDRSAIRLATVRRALESLLEAAHAPVS